MYPFRIRDFGSGLIKHRYHALYMKYARLPAELEEKALDLLEVFNEELCDLVGKANYAFPTVEVRQCDSGPLLDAGRDNCTIVVGPNAITYEPTLVANLAHESVHLHLTEFTNRWASGLEEGFAVAFELDMVERFYGQKERLHHIQHLPKSYMSALNDYTYLETISENPVLLVRNKHGRLSGITPRELRSTFPSLGWLVSRRLARCKQMRAW